MLNLYDLTKGNYQITRTITYPDYPKSRIETQAQVQAVQHSDREAEWDTHLTINGTYDGPADIVATQDYTLVWTTDGKSIRESGSALLELSSGKLVRQIWSSTITPDYGVENFPREGERLTLTISRFQVEGNRMSYEWDGVVKKEAPMAY